MAGVIMLANSEKLAATVFVRNCTVVAALPSGVPSSVIVSNSPDRNSVAGLLFVTVWRGRLWGILRRGAIGDKSRQKEAYHR
jgi:hypothetical protein